MEDIDSYLNDSSQRLKEYKFTEKDPLKVAKRHFEHGQLLINIGKHKDALDCMEFAWKSFRTSLKDEVYGSISVICGIMYACSLDALHDVVSCEKIFLELSENDPKGFHLGDYAYFLHRRKRDFDNAERSVSHVNFL
jgi:hypothetical protein